MDADAVKAMVAGVFDRAAGSYDQTGVAFFGPVGARLVQLAAPRPGERVLDLGSGRGASVFPAAERVGTGGHVLALDLAPGMVARLAEQSRAAGLAQVEVRIGDAERPEVDTAAWDVVQASLVLFLLPDAPGALRGFRHLLRPGGRLAFSWFGPEDDRWAAIHAALVAELPGEDRGPVRPGTDGPFASPEAMDAFLGEAGYVGATTVTEPTTVGYSDEATWWATMWSHGRRLALEKLRDAGVLDSTMRRMSDELDTVRRPDGSIEWTANIRYTRAHA